MKKNTSSIPVARYQLERAILESTLDNTYSKADQQDAMKFFRGCAFCGGKPASRDDHLVRVTFLGDTVRRNMVPACQPCDDSKGGRDFREWMRNSRSKHSLHGRGKTDTEIEQRIRKIQQWQGHYRPRTLDQLLGQDLSQYNAILHKMDALVAEAQQLVTRVRSRRQGQTPRRFKDG